MLESSSIMPSIPKLFHSFFTIFVDTTLAPFFRSPYIWPSPDYPPPKGEPSKGGGLLKVHRAMSPRRILRDAPSLRYAKPFGLWLDEQVSESLQP
jgi:hypothetical protein